MYQADSTSPTESPQALLKVPPEPLTSTFYSAEQVSQRVQLVQQVYRAVMKQGTHYGQIPGCEKPSLWKAGSEQLLMTFKLAVNPEVLDLSTPEDARFRVTCHITHAPTGVYLGSGIGEASSSELKYKWRKAVCPEEFEDTDASRRRLKWCQGSRGNYTIQQVRQEIADVANTVLKMAKKRAQIDATLTVTAASDIFTQDLEDMENPILDHEEGEPQQQPQAPPAMPQRKGAPVQQPAPVNDAPLSEAEKAAFIGNNHGGKIVCPECGEKVTPEGCNFCGWMPEGEQRPEPQQSRPEPPKHQAPPTKSARTPQGEKISEAQGKRFFAICMGNGITKPEMKKYLENTWGVSDTRDIVKGQMYEQCCRWAEGK